MVGSVSSTSSVLSSYSTQSSSSSSSLTEEQKTTLEEILAKYDPDSMDEESTQAMMDEIKAAGITPSEEFGEIMNAAGFEPPEKPEGPPPEEETSTTSETSETEIPQCVLDFLEKQESGTVTEDDVNTLVQTLLSTDQSTTGTIIDQKA